MALIYLENVTLYSRDCTEQFLIWVRWEGCSILAAKKMFSGMESAWNEEIKREREKVCVRKEKGEHPQRF
jgi:hypothetical protein